MNDAALMEDRIAGGDAAAPAAAPAHVHEHGEEPPPRKPPFTRLLGLGAFLAVSLAGLSWAGIQGREHQRVERDAVQHVVRDEKPRVLTVVAAKAPGTVDQVLPATASPLYQTSVYARTSGYLKRRLVDIGDRVKEGQLLAEIETPEVDSQLLRARATLNQSKATLERDRASERLAHLTLMRTRRLHGTANVSHQEYDDAEAAYKVAVATTKVSEAVIEANAADVKRLEDLQAFQKVVAPFDGVITARNYDAGALIVADDAKSAELFHVARNDTLRVVADVPQVYATAIRPGLEAPVFRREAPGREFPGRVVRTTGRVDPSTRTLRVEAEVPNPDDALLPGMYLLVRFRLEAPSNVVQVPGAAIIARAEGTKLATLDADGALRYRKVTVGRDFGNTVEVVSGLSPGETVVIRPGDDLPEGAKVEPVPSAAL
ncbi:Macrolide export protein MacA [Aquisphaera giovannonii]|uniref:Macrolide export protein MacA n=1 Tax=Aquisphaera giovannonii TaxID=406548 RepID=A0A5B9W6F9_9BACT|nr:efflux RND transporter periplasmic adaptor subunit [Aquisphaera giovannonii]QEH36193.1 Macrolide export protein MacA [Aquisphaera giovannonii]